MIRTGESFDAIAQNLAEIIDAIMSAPRSRARRIELIAHHVKRGIVHGYRAAKTGRFKEDANEKPTGNDTDGLLKTNSPDGLKTVATNC